MEDRIRAAFAEVRADGALIDNTMAYLRGKLETKQHKVKSFNFVFRVGAAAMAVLAVGIFAYNLYFTAAAHVNIDVNPSVELTLNRFDNVIGSQAFNKDGVLILSGVSLRGKTYREAIGVIISATQTNGYIAGDTLVSVTVQAMSNEKEQALCEALSRLMNEKLMPARIPAEIEVYPVTADVWSGAHNHHMSPAKYLAIQELMGVDESATIEDYRGFTIRQIRQRTQECHDTHDAGLYGGDSISGQENGHGHNNGHGYGQGH